jgi:hypothetical protein
MDARTKLRDLGARASVRYAVTLPERIVRSASALSAGVIRELMAVALPIGVRRGRLYRNLVDVTLQFLIERVGEVPTSEPQAEDLGRDFLLRRTAGNGLELMGILAFRASPVWVLAALADVSGFGRQIIPEIADALKREGLLAAGQSFETMSQLLEGLEHGAAQLAENVNAPPLDVASLRQEWKRFSATARRLPAPKLPTRVAVVGVWQQLKTTAEAEQRSVFATSSLLALSAVGSLPGRTRVLSRSALVVLGRTSAVLSEGLLDHYRQALSELSTTGFVAFGSRQIKPYSEAAVAAFSPERATLTAKLLDRI